VVVVYALAAALLYGSADFLGGVATRRATALSILPASALAGVVVVLAAALVSGQAATGAGIRWGLIAGAVGGVGLIVFYVGLAEGPMSVVAPTSALTATVLPVAVALAGGERANPAVYIGALICLVAIVMVSSAGAVEATDPAEQAVPGGPKEAPAASKARPVQAASASASLIDRLSRRGFHVRAIGYGVAAGLSFVLFFVFLRNAGRSGALWPTVASRAAGFGVVVLAACLVRARPVISRGGSRLLLATFGSGVLDASANVAYVLATRAGLFGLAVVLTSLYPGITVLLARFVLGERLRRTQLGGLALAGLGVILVTA
jgi:drug/metabolite transporter (DMT)-like permease